MAKKHADAKPKDTEQAEHADLPDEVVMNEPHGFIDDDGNHRYWQQGQIVFEPDDIALLAERGANFSAKPKTA